MITLVQVKWNTLNYYFLNLISFPPVFLLYPDFGNNDILKQGKKKKIALPKGWELHLPANFRMN